MSVCQSLKKNKTNKNNLSSLHFGLPFFLIKKEKGLVIYPLFINGYKLREPFLTTFNDMNKSYK